MLEIIRANEDHPGHPHAQKLVQVHEDVAGKRVDLLQGQLVHLDLQQRVAAEPDDDAKVDQNVSRSGDHRLALLGRRRQLMLQLVNFNSQVDSNLNDGRNEDLNL